MTSTTYVLARYFARESLLFDRLSADEPEARTEPLVVSLRAASRALSEWPASYSRSCTGGDSQVFFWQQRALGKAIIDGAGEVTKDDMHQVAG
jgi:hypothetical protein